MIICGEETEETYIAIFLLTLFLLRYRLLHLNILHIVARLYVEDAVQIQSRFELTNHEIVVGIRLHALHRETSNPWVGLRRQRVGLGVSCLEVKRLFSVESQNFG